MCAPGWKTSVAGCPARGSAHLARKACAAALARARDRAGQVDEVRARATARTRTPLARQRLRGTRRPPRRPAAAPPTARWLRVKTWMAVAADGAPVRGRVVEAARGGHVRAEQVTHVRTGIRRRPTRRKNRPAPPPGVLQQRLVRARGRRRRREAAAAHAALEAAGVAVHAQRRRRSSPRSRRPARPAPRPARGRAPGARPRTPGPRRAPACAGRRPRRTPASSCTRRSFR